MALCDEGPPAVYGLGTPDQGAGQGPSWPLGQLVEINSNAQLPMSHFSLETLLSSLPRKALNQPITMLFHHVRLL
jgi:hypothetical protein